MFKHTVHFGIKSLKESNYMIDNKLEIRGQQVHINSDGPSTLPVIVFLHGFTGSSATWKPIVAQLNGIFKTVTVDLIGHGKTAVPTNPSRYSMEEQIADLEALFSELKLTQITLVGYSMGGRIALSYAEKYPERITSLILESSSPGIQSESDRADRKKMDAQLAERILNGGIPSFVEFWENIPLFNSQKLLPEEIQHAVREERLSQSATGLANSLLGIGTGSQSSNWNKLHTLTMPVLLITGKADTKFVEIAQEMMKFLPNANHRIIKDAGHAIHVEKSTLFATMIKEQVMKVLNYEEEK